MTDRFEFDVVLADLNHRRSAAIASLEELSRSSRRTAGDLDDLERRLGMTTPQATGLRPAHARSQRSDDASWVELISRAGSNLRARGVDPSTIDLDDLLDPGHVARINRRFEGGFRVRTHLDRYDIVASVTAGVIASIVDFVVVSVPRTSSAFIGVPGSPITQWLHEQSVGHENLFARLAKVSYDRGSQVRPDLGAPAYHRLYSLGHDFPFGLVVGVFDVMRGGLTAIDQHGELIFANGLGQPVYNPFVALAKVACHWLSDGFTQAGLPPPGWALTQLLQFGSMSIRGEDYDLARVARWMYRDGYDLRHALTTVTSVAASAVTLRSYYSLRRLVDPAFAAETDHSAAAAGATSTADHPRYIAMSLIANTLATAANAGKIALFGPGATLHPSAFNYSQWLAWGRSLARFVDLQLRSPTEVLLGQGRANLLCLEEGWSPLAAVASGAPGPPS